MDGPQRPARARSFSLTSPVKINVTSTCVGAPAKIVFGQGPSNAAAGGTITPAVTVRVLDASNNQTNATTSISLGLNGGPTGAALTG